MPRLAFGGSFNPIHLGHLRCAQAVAERAGFDRVVLIPSKSPPHKPGQADLAPAEDRLAMCQLAAAQSPVFDVSDVEIHRPGPSYTLDTARELRRRGEKEVNWLIGADMLQILPKWHQPQALLKEVNFIIITRPGWSIDWESLPPEFRKLKSHIVEIPPIDISASEIRRRVRAGESIDGLTPDSVVRYIDERGLYR